MRRLTLPNAMPGSLARLARRGLFPPRAALLPPCVAWLLARLVRRRVAAPAPICSFGLAVVAGYSDALRSEVLHSALLVVCLLCWKRFSQCTVPRKHADRFCTVPRHSTVQQMS
jgi:hypothetical protein